MLMAFVTSMSLVAKEPSQGFLNGAYAKMMAQSKMIDFAKKPHPDKIYCLLWEFHIVPINRTEFLFVWYSYRLFLLQWSYKSRRRVLYSYGRL